MTTLPGDPGLGRDADETPSQAGTVQFAAGATIPRRADVERSGAAHAEADLLEASWSGEQLSDETMAELREIAGRYPQARSALLPMLHLVQSSEGYVSPAGIEACAEILGQTPAEVTAVATFYSMYKRRPIGDYLVGVCTNTLCAVMGGDAIFEHLKSHLDVGNNETTPDGKVTLEHIECNAACDYAPVVMVNWEFFDNQTPQSAAALVDELRLGGSVTATRGARVCTWREAERVLAGFPDDRADEGPTAGPATLVGLQLARRNDWTAPEPESDRAASNAATSNGRGSAAAGASSGAAPDSAGAAVSDADTSRAGSETVLDSATPAGDAAAAPDPDRTDSAGSRTTSGHTAAEQSMPNRAPGEGSETGDASRSASPSSTTPTSENTAVKGDQGQ